MIPDHPKRPMIGECSQFGHGRYGVIACRVTGYFEKNGLIVSYFDRAKQQVIEGATISVFDLVSDEDIVLHPELTE